MDTQVDSLEKFEDAATSFVKTLHPKSAGGTLVTLSGELGAGKTAFVKAGAKALGLEDDLTSPTFVLMKSYEIPHTDDGFARLVHIDAYRLENGVGLSPLRFDELLGQAENLIMLEWPEKVADALPVADIAIRIEALPDGARNISYG